ncbi:MAG: hypothetical protein ACREFY_05225 [Acetobacteraceae bacterium]
MLPWVGGTAVGVLLAALFAWALWPSARPPHARPPAPVVSAPTHRLVVAPHPALPAAAPPAAAVPPSATAGAPSRPATTQVPAFTLRTATRRQILAEAPTTLAVFRYAFNPNIVVLDFPTLQEQGLMLDRVAALVEKAGLPRDRVVSWAELRKLIRAHGDTIGTYYYGHDYSAAALARFFVLAARDHRQLNPQEQRLHALLVQLGWLRPGVVAGLITLPRVGADPYVTTTACDVILTHELSHGEFFSNPAYAAYVWRFWHDGLTDAERKAIRRFLGSEEYDISQQEVVVNEMQAYLMFTRNPQFFRAADIGITQAQRVQLEQAFLAGMPHGWLRDRLAALNREH